MSATEIQWASHVWNPTTGCDRVSAGCDNCYALGMAKRLKAMGSAKYQTDGDPRTSGPGFGIAMHPDVLLEPLRWRKPRLVFVNSMSDLFHKGVTDEFIASVFAVMALSPRHTFQILTKRPGRMRSLLNDVAWQEQVGHEIVATMVELGKPVPLSTPTLLDGPLPNVWLGASVENQQWANIRIPALLMTPAAVRFLSCEPLLGPVDLTRVAWSGGGGTHLDVANGRHGQPGVWAAPAKRVNWVIAGGESGLASRPMNADWARSLRDQCASAGVAFHFKQRGGRTPKANGRELDGRTHDEFPARPADREAVNRAR